jgi:hypothetical protein
VSPLLWWQTQRGNVKMAIAVALPLVAAVLGFALRSALVPVLLPAECPDPLNAPIAILIDKIIVPATAQHFGPGWIVIPLYNQDEQKP